MITSIETGSSLDDHPEMQSVRGKVVVVVGGATGVGQAVARLLLTHGARVFITASGAEELAAALMDLRRDGTSIDGKVVDLSCSEDVRRLFDAVERELGGSRCW